LVPHAPIKRSKSGRFPVFDVAPGTPMMSLSDIQRFIDDEGLFEWPVTLKSLPVRY